MSFGLVKSIWSFPLSKIYMCIGAQVNARKEKKGKREKCGNEGVAFFLEKQKLLPPTTRGANKNTHPAEFVLLIFFSFLSR